MSVTPIPDELRERVIALHGSRCLCCGVQCTWSGPTKLHIDHVVPESWGGRTVLSNLQVLCRTCNLRKGSRSAKDYRRVKPRRMSRRDRLAAEAAALAEQQRLAVEQQQVNAEQQRVDAEIARLEARQIEWERLQANARYPDGGVRASGLVELQEFTTGIGPCKHTKTRHTCRFG
jgi:hypothetical protein